MGISTPKVRDACIFSGDSDLSLPADVLSLGDGYLLSTLQYAQGSVKAADANRLNKLVTKAGSLPGEELESVAVVVSERRMLRKLYYE